MNKVCPRCGKSFEKLANYCDQCGIELKKEPNRCSQERHSLCKGRALPDESKYCIYCGAPTTYALAERDGEW